MMKRNLSQVITLFVTISLVSLAITVLKQPAFLQRVLEFDLSIKWLWPLLLLSFVGLAGFVSYFEYKGIGCQDGIVRRGPREKVVALTFDDGPNPIYTPKILDILKEKQVRASFFVLGVHVRKYPEIARRIVREGHDIGNHTYTHRDLVPATRAVILRQVRLTNKIIRHVTGVETRLFRPPRGVYSNAVRKLLVEEEGYRIILWTVSSIDWRRVSPRLIVRRVARYVSPGGILLFHDSGALIRREGGRRVNTVQALPLVIDYLRAIGYEIVPVSELLRRLEEEEIEPRGALERI
jgi:peptidoglycan/xylan/chitin deacetylase (PgdA/CDA1 family)